MSTYYILDGYNVIHADPELSEALDTNFEETRNIFIDIVSEAFKDKEDDIQIIFDGQDEGYGSTNLRNKIRIIYTHSQQSADDWIKESIQKQKSAKKTIVVTNDKSIRRECQSFGAKLLYSEEFINRLRPEAKLDLPDAKDSLSFNTKKSIQEEFLKLNTTNLENELKKIDSTNEETLIVKSPEKKSTHINEITPEFKEFLDFDVDSLEKEILGEDSALIEKIKKVEIKIKQQEEEIKKTTNKRSASEKTSTKHDQIMDDEDFDDLMKRY